MSVIGIDFGNESCYVAAAKAGGIETLANDYSLRATPSFVAFDGKKRIIGVAAKNQQVTNMNNTVSGFKRLLGRRYNDPHVHRELTNIPTKVEPNADGTIGIKVNYLDKEQTFTPEQITAMLFTKLKETSTTALQTQVNDCVITCPVYYTNAERRALLDAAQIAGLNVLRLMNETTATALSYGFYKADLPDDKPRNVIFVDCGNSSLQVSACAFTKGKLKMLASTWDQIGGRDFDAALADHFAREFNERFKINAKTNARAYLRLVTEIEKVKKQMSANSTKLPLNIECFMNDIDVTSSIQRVEMEALCASLFQRVEQTFKRLLLESKLPLEEIHSVEIVGGSSRIPAIKHLIEQVFGKTASTTLNQDESVSRGAALQCAIMSPAVKVREFSVTDIQNYGVKLCYDDSTHAGGEIEIFPAFHPAPFARIVTIKRRDPFSISVLYNQQVPYPDPTIGTWYIKDVKPNDRGEAQDVKVKIRINTHGIITVANAVLVDKKDIEENAQPPNVGEVSSDENIGEQQQANANEGADVSQEACYDNEDDSNTSTDSSPGGLGWMQRAKAFLSGPEKKKKSKNVDLNMDVKTHGFSSSDMELFIQQESKMIDNDVRETQRVDARNALEEFIYDTRNKLQGGPLERYVLENTREDICAQLNGLENWLYEDDGENCDRDTYVAKLNELRARTDPIKERAHDYEYCPGAFEELKHAINNARVAVDEFKSRAPKYDHLTDAEFLTISEKADRAQKWLDESWNKFKNTQRTSDSPVKVADIRHETQVLNQAVKTVTSRPKPKPASKQTPAKDAHAGAEQNGENMEPGDNHPPGSQNAPDEMEVE